MCVCSFYLLHYPLPTLANMMTDFMWKNMHADRKAAEASGFFKGRHMTEHDRMSDQYEDDVKSLQTSMHVSRSEAEKMLLYGAPEMAKTGADVNT
jgi:hypothetical protein